MSVPESPAEFPVHIGRCLYCGRSDVRLSDEHIIPLALDGEWKLLEASCDVHARITSRFELEVLRGALLVPRATMGMKTRRPKERPSHLKVSLRDSTAGSSVMLPVAEHPGFFALPKFAPPGNAPPDGPTPGITALSFHVAYRKPATAKVRATHGDSFGAPFPDLVAFARMLAKIAYCFAATRIDLDRLLATPILDAILGQDPLIGNFVGSITEAAETRTEGKHQVVLAWSDTSIRAHVRLFAALQAPEYVIVLQ